MTAVEWLLEQINNVKPNQFCSIETIKEWCEQALEMEKQQSEKYATFAINCDRKQLPVLNFEDYIKL
jgi:hypothetical protein